jgi:hypothetical protein
MDAYLQHMIHYSQDINEDNHIFNESLVVVISLVGHHLDLYWARASII